MLNIKNNKIKATVLILLFFVIISSSFGSVLAENIRGGNVLVESDKTLEKTSFLSGDNVRIDGNINGTTFVSSENIEVNGIIDGDLHYSSQNKADFSKDSKVLGKIKWGKYKPKVTKSILSFDTLIKVILSTLAPLVVWIFVKLIRPSFWINLTQDKSDSPFKILAFGILALVFIPIGSLLLIITNIGIPLGLILLALYIMINYISKIILSLFITYWFQSKYGWSNSQAFWMFLLGLIILTILDLIPMVGWFFSLIIVAFGHGSIILSIKKYHEKNAFSSHSLEL